MYTGPTIFSQLMQHLPWHHFDRCVARYDGNHKVKEFKCSSHFRVMSFAQLTYRESLRDIEACLRAMQPKLYHMGIRSTVSRNNLSNANEQRDWRIYAEFAQYLIIEARGLYANEELSVDLDASVYALDSTTIDLCLSMFPWARFRRHKGAVKMHTLMNLRGSIPEFILISDGKMHDVNVLDYLVPMPGAYYLMDRGYLDFQRLFEVNTCRAFFVTRAKDNFKFKRRYSRPVDRSTGLICDQTVILTTFYPAKAYPEPLRRIKFRDPNDPSSLLVFLTNDFTLPAMTITKLYKARWMIDVAEKAEVSRSTVGHVLLGTGAGSIRVGEATAERIRLIAAELGYHPNRAAQQLRGVTTQTLGVLMDTVNAPVMNDRLAAMEKEASTRGYRLLIGQLHGDLDALRGYLGDFDSRGVDAIFCLFDVTAGRAERLMPLLGGRDDVVLHGKPLHPDGYCVRVDTARAVAAMVDHLVKQGRRRIALQLEGVTDELMAVRREAYLAALESHGAPTDASLTWTDLGETVDPTPRSVGDAIDSLIVGAQADAIIASNDLWAAGLIQGLKARGHRVPEDVAVTGYDNLHLGTIIDPPLTTIDQQHALYARAAVDLLIRLATASTAPPADQRTIVIPPKLIVRRSA